MSSLGNTRSADFWRVSLDQERYIKHIESGYKRNIEIVRAKSSDYANSDDPFWNFRLCETLGLCSVEIGIMVRILDKIGRIANLMNWTPAVKDETISDTISDAQNYLGILDAWLTDQKEEGFDPIFTGLAPCNSRYAAERRKQNNDNA